MTNIDGPVCQSRQCQASALDATHSPRAFDQLCDVAEVTFAKVVRGDFLNDAATIDACCSC